MNFDFAKATDITEYAKKHFNELYGEYEKIFITPDVNDYHILRILKGFGYDYVEDEDSFIIEQQMIPKQKNDSIDSLRKLYKILSEDDGSNYDYDVKESLEECVEIVDGGYGINH